MYLFPVHAPVVGSHLAEIEYIIDLKGLLQTVL